MNTLTRFGVSLPEKLLKRFDRLMKQRDHTNRSEALRDLIRERLVDEEWNRDEEAFGTITLVYDHHQPGLQQKLTDLQHRSGKIIVATSHVHIDHHHCLEALIVRGKAGELKHFADRLIGTKGVLHGALTRTAAIPR